VRGAWAIAGTIAAGALLPGAPQAAGPGPAQEVRGTVRAPVRSPTDATFQSWPDGERLAYRNTGSNGVIGFTFALADGVERGSFRLDLLGGATGLEDLDVAFYTSLNPPTPTGWFQDRATGGESSTIPARSYIAVVTLFRGADASFRFRAWPRAGSAAREAALPPPGIHPELGKGGGAAAQRLRARSHVVIAVIDTGINPYHLAYRRPEYSVHPSEYIEGYPASAPAISLSLGASSYEEARARDARPVWDKVKEKTLYWFPGTNIIGAYSPRDYRDPPPIANRDGIVSPIESRPILDESGHGTGTTSVATGGLRPAGRGEPFGANPDALLVIVEGFGEDAIAWAVRQPWIDFISGSYGDPAAAPYDDRVPDLPDALPAGFARADTHEYRYTAPFVLRDGRTACFSAGNGVSRTLTVPDRSSSLRPTSGPAWVVTVGAVSPRNDADYWWDSVPVDVSSYGAHWPAAAPFSIDGEQDFRGTSNATPLVCGVFSKALLEARRALGDTREGIHVARDGRRVPALGRNGLAGGLLADGVLTRDELQAAVLSTARPGSLDVERLSYEPLVVPDTPASFTQEGYGVANISSALRAVAVILGRAAMPDRSDVDAWMRAVDAIRDQVYPPPSYSPAPR
jgi:hypothetical protein